MWDVSRFDRSSCFLYLVERVWGRRGCGRRAFDVGIVSVVPEPDASAFRLIIRGAF